MDGHIIGRLRGFGSDLELQHIPSNRLESQDDLTYQYAFPSRRDDLPPILAAEHQEFMIQNKNLHQYETNITKYLESQRSIKDGRRVGLLSSMSLIFLPLSFSSSLFGMNWSHIDTASSGLFVFTAVSGTLVVVAGIVLFLPPKHSGKRWRYWEPTMVRPKRAQLRRKKGRLYLRGEQASVQTNFGAPI